MHIFDYKMFHQEASVETIKMINSDFQYRATFCIKNFKYIHNENKNITKNWYE